MKYVFITFIPGAAGNFFSRCLNLISGAYCFGYDNVLPDTLDQKLEMLSYESVLNRQLESGSWINFENQLKPYYEIVEHHKLPPTACSIWSGHLLTPATNLAGPDDQIFNFYIDPGENFEWACMNALYKNSFMAVEWFINGKKMLEDPTIYKINLGNFLKDWDCFLLEFKKVTSIIGHSITESEEQAVKIIYTQWKTTILAPGDIKHFKRKIGFFM